MREREPYIIHDPWCLERPECYCIPLRIEPTPEPVYISDLTALAQYRRETARMIRALG